jgi:hypothetical protein
MDETIDSRGHQLAGIPHLPRMRVHPHTVTVCRPDDCRHHGWSKRGEGLWGIPPEPAIILPNLELRRAAGMKFFDHAPGVPR